MTVKEKIAQSLKESMKSKDAIRVQTNRNILSAFMEYEKKKAENEVTDEIAIDLLSNIAKKRKESIDMYSKGNRPDLVEIEQKELTIVMEYLPEQLTEKELTTIIALTMSENGIEKDKKNIGRIMGIVMPNIKGLADGNDVRNIVQKFMKE